MQYTLKSAKAQSHNAKLSGPAPESSGLAGGTPAAGPRSAKRSAEGPKARPAPLLPPPPYPSNLDLLATAEARRLMRAAEGHAEAWAAHGAAVAAHARRWNAASESGRVALGAAPDVPTGLSVLAYRAAGAEGSGAPKRRPKGGAALWRARYKAMQGLGVRVRYSMTVRTGKVTLRAEMPGNGVGGGGGKRRAIAALTVDSRKRMQDQLLGVDWDDLESRGYALFFVALTYPKFFPHDGTECKKDFDAFYKRVERKFGLCPSIWKREFQRRGAPHYHIVLAVPGRPDEKTMQEAVRAAWTPIGGQETEDEEQAATQCELVQDKKRITSYISMYMGKDKQNEVPQCWYRIDESRWETKVSASGKEYRVCEWVKFEKFEEPFINPGRFWGIRRASLFKSTVINEVISAVQYHEGELAIRAAWAKSGLPDYPSGLSISYVEFDDELLLGVIEEVHKRECERSERSIEEQRKKDLDKWNPS